MNGIYCTYDANEGEAGKGEVCTDFRKSEACEGIRCIYHFGVGSPRSVPSVVSECNEHYRRRSAVGEVKGQHS